MPESYQAIFRRRSVARAAKTTKKQRLMIDSRMNVEYAARPIRSNRLKPIAATAAIVSDAQRTGQQVLVVREVDDRWRGDEKNVVPALRGEERHQRQEHRALDPFRERDTAPAEEHERDDAEQ